MTALLALAQGILAGLAVALAVTVVLGAILCALALLWLVLACVGAGIAERETPDPDW